ncbi:MAG: hypothetical protein R3C49_04235 [Planctomycetaceae bacterium]
MTARSSLLFLIMAVMTGLTGIGPLHEASASACHPISITEAQVFVARTSARMRIQLFAEDLYLFQGLEPDNRDVLSPAELKRGLEQHRQFLLEKVVLRDAQGQPFKGQVTDLQPFEIPEEGIKVGRPDAASGDL